MADERRDEFGREVENRRERERSPHPQQHPTPIRGANVSNPQGGFHLPVI